MTDDSDWGYNVYIDFNEGDFWIEENLVFSYFAPASHHFCLFNLIPSIKCGSTSFLRQFYDPLSDWRDGHMWYDGSGSEQKTKMFDWPFKLSNEQCGAGDAQSHKRQWVDDRFNKGQASGDPWQDANDHFEPWPRWSQKNRMWSNSAVFEWHCCSFVHVQMTRGTLIHWYR